MCSGHPLSQCPASPPWETAPPRDSDQSLPAQAGRHFGGGRRRQCNSDLNRLAFLGLCLRNQSLGGEECRLRHRTRTQLDADARRVWPERHRRDFRSSPPPLEQLMGLWCEIARCEQTSEPPCPLDSYSVGRYSEHHQYRSPSAPGWVTSSPDSWRSGKWRHPQKFHRTHACRRLPSRRAGARWMMLQARREPILPQEP